MLPVSKALGLRRSVAGPAVAVWRDGGAKRSGAGMRTQGKTGLSMDAVPHKAGVCLPRVA